jgi:iron complex transport system substrate-binding protein
MFRRLVLAASLAASLALPAFAADTAPLPDTSRLAVVGGSLLEIVFALGEGGKVIARDTTGIYPPEAATLPDVGYMRALSPEGVLSVNPSALLLVEGSGPPEALEVLTKAAIPQVTVPEGYSHAGILLKIATVGAALGVPDKAAALSAEVDAQMQAAEAITSAIPDAERKRVLFVISMADGKVRAAGGHTAADSVITLSGGINPLHDVGGYQTLSDEAILAAKPDAILMMSNGGEGDFSAEFIKNPALAATPAITNGKVIKLDGAYLLGFGPRTPAAIAEVARALYGEAR